MRACAISNYAANCGFDRTSRDALVEVEEVEKGQRLRGMQLYHTAGRKVCNYLMDWPTLETAAMLTVFYSAFLTLIKTLRYLCEKSCTLNPEKCQCRKEGGSTLCLINKTFQLRMYIKSQKGCVALLQYRAFSTSLSTVISLL